MPADNPQAYSGGGPEEGMKAMQGIAEAMGNLLAGGAEGGMPKEAVAKLEEANAAYNEFLSIVTGAPQGASQQMSPEEAAGGRPVTPGGVAA